MALSLHDPSTMPKKEEDAQAEEGLQGGNLDIGAGQRSSVEKLQQFGQKLSAKRDEWMAYRVSLGVDQRWKEDLDQYEGRDGASMAAANMMKSVQAGFPMTNAAQPQATRSTIVVNQTRTKTNGAEARVADIVLPTDDRNWSCEPTPLPMLASDLKSSEMAMRPDNGQPLMGPQLDDNGDPSRGPDGAVVMVPYTKKQLAQEIEKMSWDAAESMQKTIDDQLSTCDWQSECRKVIHDAAVLGTGVMRGPIVTGRTRRAWVQVKDVTKASTWVQQIVQVNGPASWRMNPMNVWFDPGCGDDIHSGQGVIEVEDLTPRRVRDLAKQPHFIPSQIARVLDEGPQRKRAASIADETTAQQGLQKNPNFEVWTYTGEADFEDLVAIEIPGLPAVNSDEALLMQVSVVVTMINNTIVKVVLNPLEDGSLPYDVLNWEKARDMPYGYGIPYLMRSPSKILTSAWRMMMDNAGICAGPTIVLKKGAIKPQDGVMQITPRKIWLAEDDVDDVEKAFTSINFDSHQEELKEIIQMAEDLADKDTGVPALMQGEQGSAPDTVGGMSILVNSSTVVLRRIVKQYDDQLTEPHVTRYYDYNMAYGEDESIKGDYDLKARGSSALLIRDIQNQAYMQLLQVGMSGPLSLYIDPEKLARKVVAAQHIPPSDIWRSQSDIDRREKAAAENPPMDPRIQASQIAAQARVQQTEAVQKSRETIAGATLQHDSVEAQKVRDHAELLAQLAYKTAVLTLANQSHETVQQINAEMAQVAIVQRNENARFAADLQVKKTQGSGIDGSVVGVGPSTGGAS